jgi:hypothetical protein
MNLGTILEIANAAYTVVLRATNVAKIMKNRDSITAWGNRMPV